MTSGASDRTFRVTLLMADVIGVECVPRSQGPCRESNTEADAELGMAGWLRHDLG